MPVCGPWFGPWFIFPIIGLVRRRGERCPPLAMPTTPRLAGRRSTHLPEFGGRPGNPRPLPPRPSSISGLLSEPPRALQDLVCGSGIVRGDRHVKAIAPCQRVRLDVLHGQRRVGGRMLQATGDLAIERLLHLRRAEVEARAIRDCDAAEVMPGPGVPVDGGDALDCVGPKWEGWVRCGHAVARLTCGDRATGSRNENE